MTPPPTRTPTWRELTNAYVEIEFHLDGVLHKTRIMDEKAWDSLKDIYWPKIVSYKIRRLTDFKEYWGVE